MSEGNRHEITAVATPERLLAHAALDATNCPRNIYEAEFAINGRLDLARDLQNFIVAQVDACRRGQKILLLRDLIPNAVVDLAQQNAGHQAMELVDKALMDSRMQLAANLMISGANPLVEESILTRDDFMQNDPGSLKPKLRWAKLKTTDSASKINWTPPGLPVMTGPRPRHRYFHDEVVHDLRGAHGALRKRFLVKPSEPANFYLTTAKYAGNRKTLLEALTENPNQDGFDKFMLDIINAMKAINFAHHLGMVHRDIKPDNIFEDGPVHDNLTLMEEEDAAYSQLLVGTPFFMPDDYKVEWVTDLTLYFRDIFAFAMSIAIGVAATTSNWPQNYDKFYKKNKYRFFTMSPEDFVNSLKKDIFPATKNEKLIMVEDVLEAMIRSEGNYTLADAVRHLSQTFGDKV